MELSWSVRVEQVEPTVGTMSVVVLDVLLGGSIATGRLVGAASKSVTARTRWLNRIRGRSDGQERS
jgi:hypothetical protein